MNALEFGNPRSPPSAPISPPELHALTHMDLRLPSTNGRDEADSQNEHFEASRYSPSVATVGLIVFTWLAVSAWLRPLALPDEGRYVGVAWEMVRSSNWLVPTLDAMPYFHKPPLFYWLTAISTSALGNNEWAARLPTLLSATGVTLGLFAFLRRWSNRAIALVALVVLVTMPLFFAGAQFANLDTLVAACISGTILCAADVILGLRHIAYRDQPQADNKRWKHNADNSFSEHT